MTFAVIAATCKQQTRRDYATVVLGGTMKIIAGIGILFLSYGLLQILNNWERRNGTEKAIWFIIIAIGAGWCIPTLFR